MRALYFKLIVSTANTIKNSGNYNSEWRIMAYIVTSMSFMINILSIWLLIDHFFHGATDFLAFDIGIGTYATGLIYIFVYFLLPFLTMNYFWGFKGNKFEILCEKYPEAKNKKLFAIHFIGSFAFGLICTYINLRIM